jgi:hypothetical protein
MALAITSFPVPVSPWIRTAESAGATLSTSAINARNFGLDPIKSKVVIALFLYECDICSAFSPDQADPALRLGSLSRDPLADVWIAIRQPDVSRFALSEKIYAVLTRQSHILEVENDAAIFPFRGDERFQLGNMFFVDPAAEGEDHFPVRRPLNSQHCVSWRVRVQACCHRNTLKINTLPVTIIAD